MPLPVEGTAKGTKAITPYEIITLGDFYRRYPDSALESCKVFHPAFDDDQCTVIFYYTVQDSQSNAMTER